MELPKIPRLAPGGIVRPQSGGIVTVVAADMTECIVPVARPDGGGRDGC